MRHASETGGVMMKDSQEVAYTLLGMLQVYAPDKSAQERCAGFYNAMKSDGFSDREMVKALSGSLYDGIAHGNWPWTIDPKGRY